MDERANRIVAVLFLAFLAGFIGVVCAEIWAETVGTWIGSVSPQHPFSGERILATAIAGVWLGRTIPLVK